MSHFKSRLVSVWSAIFVSVIALAFVTIGSVVSPAPAAAFPCPDGSQTCGPNPTNPTITPPTQTPTQGGAPNQGGGDQGGVLPTGQPGTTSPSGPGVSGSANTPAVPTPSGCIVGCDTPAPAPLSGSTPPASSDSLGHGSDRLNSISEKCKEATRQLNAIETGEEFILVSGGAGKALFPRAPKPAQGGCMKCAKDYALDKARARQSEVDPRSLKCSVTREEDIKTLPDFWDKNNVTPLVTYDGPDTPVSSNTVTTYVPSKWSFGGKADVTGGGNAGVAEGSVTLGGSVQYDMAYTTIAKLTQSGTTITRADGIPVGSKIGVAPVYATFVIPVVCDRVFLGVTQNVFYDNVTVQLPSGVLYVYFPPGSDVPRPLSE